MYTVQEASKVTGYSVRKIQRNCIKYQVPKQEGVYMISETMLNAWKTSTNKPPTKTTSKDTDKNDTPPTNKNDVALYTFIGVLFIVVVLLFAYVFNFVVDDKNKQINDVKEQSKQQVQELNKVISNQGIIIEEKQAEILKLNDTLQWFKVGKPKLYFLKN